MCLVRSGGVGGVTVTQLAHHHEVTRQQIYAWRHALKKTGLLPPSADVAFLPADFSNLQNRPVSQDIPRAPALVEVRLQNGRSRLFDGTMDAGILARLIQALRLRIA